MGVQRVWLTNRTGGLSLTQRTLCVYACRDWNVVAYDCASEDLVGLYPLALAVNEQSNGSTFFLFRSLLSFFFLFTTVG